MSSRNSKAMWLLVPGIFLLVLGAGNFAVGVFKGAQYDEVLVELAILEPTIPVPDGISPLRRIQIAKQAESRSLQRETKARARRDFYELVEYGGKVFISLSTLFLLSSALLHLVERKRRKKHLREILAERKSFPNSELQASPTSS